MEDAVKLCIRMWRLFPLSWRLCVVENYYAERHYRWASWVSPIGFWLWVYSKTMYTVDEEVKTAERNGDYVVKEGCDPQKISFILMYDTCSCVGNYTFTKEKGITFWLTLGYIYIYIYIYTSVAISHQLKAMSAYTLGKLGLLLTGFSSHGNLISQIK